MWNYLYWRIRNGWYFKNVFEIVFFMCVYFCVFIYLKVSFVFYSVNLVYLGFCDFVIIVFKVNELLRNIYCWFYLIDVVIIGIVKDRE